MDRKRPLEIYNVTFAYVRRRMEDLEDFANFLVKTVQCLGHEFV